MEAITTCELCKAKLRLNIDDFNIQELYRTHAQVSRVVCTAVNMCVCYCDSHSICTFILCWDFLAPLSVRSERTVFVFLSVQSEYDEFISSGLYLVVLLHFCEQRFSDVLGAVDAAGVGKHTHALSLSLSYWIYTCVKQQGVNLATLSYG